MQVTPLPMRIRHAIAPFAFIAASASACEPGLGLFFRPQTGPSTAKRSPAATLEAKLPGLTSLPPPPAASAARDSATRSGPIPSIAESTGNAQSHDISDAIEKARDQLMPDAIAGLDYDLSSSTAPEAPGKTLDGLGVRLPEFPSASTPAAPNAKPKAPADKGKPTAPEPTTPAKPVAPAAAN